MAKYSSRPYIRTQVHKIKPIKLENVKVEGSKQKPIGSVEGFYTTAFNIVVQNLNLNGGKERTGQESFF